MSTSFPSLMTRKRRITGYSGLDSSKVLADYVPNLGFSKSYYQDNFTSKQKDNRPPAGRERCGNPNKVTFIYENSRFINEPICYANTKSTTNVQDKWWSNEVKAEKFKPPIYSTATVQRTDYKKCSQPLPERATRFSSTKRVIAKSILPHHETDNNFMAKERISYEHNFDCREGRKERGRLHGSFVWEPVHDDNLKEKIRKRLVLP